MWDDVGKIDLARLDLEFSDLDLAGNVALKDWELAGMRPGLALFYCWRSKRQLIFVFGRQRQSERCAGIEVHFEFAAGRLYRHDRQHFIHSISEDRFAICVWQCALTQADLFPLIIEG